MKIKERQRYILFQIIKKKENMKVKKSIFLKTLWSSIWRYFGLKGANKMGLWLVELNNKNNYGILRVSQYSKEMAISALTLIKNINGMPIIFSTVKTSGTLKSLKKNNRIE
ncbi:MAG: Rpp14/Pop5 family protein [Promethearchaeia archaeon]